MAGDWVLLCFHNTFVSSLVVRSILDGNKIVVVVAYDERELLTTAGRFLSPIGYSGHLNTQIRL